MLQPATLTFGVRVTPPKTNPNPKPGENLRVVYCWGRGNLKVDPTFLIFSLSLSLAFFVLFSKNNRAANYIANNLKNSHVEVYLCAMRNTPENLLKVFSKELHDLNCRKSAPQLFS